MGDLIIMIIEKLFLSEGAIKLDRIQADEKRRIIVYLSFGGSQ